MLKIVALIIIIFIVFFFIFKKISWVILSLLGVIVCMMFGVF